MTSTGMIVGTPSYMSPEQAEGARVGPPSDVFSLGCVIVFAATGRGPFGGGPRASMLYRVVHAEPALDEVPGGLRELAAACLTKAPADRPGLAALVEAAAAGRAPDEGDALATFWPVPVTGLIRSHQARLTTEMRERTAAPRPEPGTTGPQTTGPQTTGAAHLAGGGHGRAGAGRAVRDRPPDGGRRDGLRRQQRREGVRAARQRRQTALALPTRGSATSGIAMAGGVVYAGGNDYLVRALRASDGKQLMSFTADGPVESQIAVADGIAYFGSEQIYELKGPPT